MVRKAKWGAAVLGLGAGVAAMTGLARPAEAFCGFYVSGADAKLFNDATQVVLMREGTRTVLSMQNAYKGPPEKFAMVVPVPVVLQKENVRTLPKELFAKVDQLDAPRLVEYWEQDPCAPELDYMAKTGARNRMAGGAAPAAPGAAAKDLGVTIEAQFTVGEYEIVVLSAKDSSGLDTWLKQEKYRIPEGSEPYLRPYVQSGSKFFVARVDPTKVTFDGKGTALLSPLRFHYDAESFSLPVRLGLVNSSGKQDLVVHVLAKNQRFEVANYPNVTIPTNLDVAESARGSFGSFYAALFDKTLEKNPKAVVTEYSWASSTCDPCPGPTLSPSDLATLGADVLPSGDLGTPAPKPGPGPASRTRWSPSSLSGFVITRLHARYDRENLGEDLVFRAAPAIVGGREVPAANGELEHGATPAPMNNFQGRYAIRHPWGGAVTCKEPKRGKWGRPPAGVLASEGAGTPKAAKDLAFAPRDAKLATFVRSAIPELAVTPEGAPVSPAMPAAGNVTAAAEATRALDGGTPSSGAQPVRTDPRAPGGCGGCIDKPSGRVGSFGPLSAIAAAAVLAGRRRSRRGHDRGVKAATSPHRR
jgi:hypothetical protein